MKKAIDQTMEYKNEIRALRKLIPIGIKEGLKILSEAKGNVVKAAEAFKLKRTAILAEKANLDTDEAKRYLEENEYDIAVCLHKIDEDRYTYTERILRSNKQAADKRGLIAVAVYERHSIKAGSFPKKENLANLNSDEYVVMMIGEWIDFCEWEMTDHGISGSTVGEVAELIETKLNRADLGNLLQQAVARKEALWAGIDYEHLRKTDFEKLLKHGEFVREDLEYDARLTALEKAFPELEEALVDFIARHKEAFP